MFWTHFLPTHSLKICWKRFPVPYTWQPWGQTFCTVLVCPQEENLTVTHLGQPFGSNDFGTVKEIVLAVRF